MDKIISELNKLKKGIDEAKTQVTVLQDRKTQYLKRLKDEFSLTSIDLAEKWVANIEKELQKSGEEIQKRFKALQEKYNW